MNGMFIIGTNANENQKREAFERLKANVNRDIDDLNVIVVRCIFEAFDDLAQQLKAVVRKNKSDPLTIIDLYKQNLQKANEQLNKTRNQRLKEANEYIDRMRARIDETNPNNKNKIDCTELMLVTDRVKEYVDATLEEMRLPSFFFGELTNTRDLIYYPPKRRN